MTKQEKIIEGLSTGKDAPLEVRLGGVAGRGVFAKELIHKGSWLCEYKTTRVFDRSEKERVEEEYRVNNEGSYIVESAYSVPGAGYLCFDATRKYHQVGRYFNHARNPNASITPPFNVRGKWRVGFLAVRDIEPGDEVVWNYNVKGEEWSSCKLVGGVVKPANVKSNIKGKQRMAKECEVDEDEEESEPAMSRSISRSKRRLCYRPVEGCTSRPLVKLSNHLSQVHQMNPCERAKYLGCKRKFASKKDVEDGVKKSVLRRSQRTLTSLFLMRLIQTWSRQSPYLKVTHLDHLGLVVSKCPMKSQVDWNLWQFGLWKQCHL